MKTSFFVLTCLLASSNSYAVLESCDQPSVRCDSSNGCSKKVGGTVYEGERIQNWCRFPHNASPGGPTPLNNGDRGFPKANSTKINKSF